MFAKTPGLRAGKDALARLEHGAGIRGRVLDVRGDDKATVVATLFGVAMEADLASDGRFEVRGLPADAAVDLVASLVGPANVRREARTRARVGASDIELAPIAIPPASR